MFLDICSHVVTSIGSSEDGKIIVSGSNNGTMLAWYFMLDSSFGFDDVLFPCSSPYFIGHIEAVSPRIN